LGICALVSAAISLFWLHIPRHAGATEALGTAE
jgi:hypothetical protein